MTYTSPTVIAQRQALVERLLDGREEDLAERIASRLPLRLYGLREEGHEYDRVWAADADAAKAVAVEQFDPSAYDTAGGTAWVDVWAVNVLDRCDHAVATMTLGPAEPDCARGHSHQWESPHEVVGGLVENPGVVGHGGGVIIREVCRHCGAYRVTDTWAQRRDTGEQGLTAIHYEDADEASLEWIESQTESEEG